jgi:hypothetical protein
MVENIFCYFSKHSLQKVDGAVSCPHVNVTEIRGQTGRKPYTPLLHMGELNMKASSIQIGKTYEIAIGRGKTIVKVGAVNPKSGAWICETQTGKAITIGDATRFLKTIGETKGTKKGKPKKKSGKPAPPKPVAKAKAAPSPIGSRNKEKAEAAKPITATDCVAQLGTVFKEADRRLRAAKNAFDLGLIDQAKLDKTTAEHDEALARLRAAGGKVGSGGRCLGQMSGLEAAYRVLAESGEPMNAQQIYDTIIDRGYWDPQGLTPDATLSSAILHEMKKKGDASRFKRPGTYLSLFARLCNPPDD